MLLYAQVDEHFKKRYVVIGQYLALGILVAVSLLGAYGLNFVPQEYIGLLGLVPIALGVKEWLEYRKEQRKSNAQEDEPEEDEPEEDAPKKEVADNVAGQTAHKSKTGKLQTALTNIKTIASKVINPQILSVIVIVVANGADNIGVYIPLFTGYSTGQIAIAVLVFALMMALWCFLGDQITNLPGVKAVIQKYKHIAVPVVLIALGFYIMLKSM